MAARTVGDGDPERADVEQTALVVPFPALDDLLGPHRRRLDPSAALGIPPHVTIVYPFAPLDRLDPAALGWLGDLFAATPAFGCRFGRTRWFLDEVLWLDPDPSDEFCRLTLAVVDRFPQYPPYGGQFPGVTPHLTLGQRDRDQADPATVARDVQGLRQAELVVADLLPVELPADRVWLMRGTQDPDGWEVVRDFPLGPDPAAD